jgi:16S rRNA processing protein RimM
MVDAARLCQCGFVTRSSKITGGTDYVPIAEIARPHGVRGEVRLKLYNDASTMIVRGRKVTLLPPESGRATKKAPDSTTIGGVRKTPGGLLVELAGVSDRDAADLLRGTQLAVLRDELPDLDDGEFYVCDLQGARVELTSGDVIGEVVGLESYPGCDVLRVALDSASGGRTIEVPLVDSYVALVDADAHLVKLHHISEL